MKRRKLLKTIVATCAVTLEKNVIASSLSKNDTKESLTELFSITVSKLKDYRDFEQFWGFFCFYCEVSIKGKNLSEAFRDEFFSLEVENKEKYFISLSNDIKNNEMEYLSELKHLMEINKLL